MLKTFELLPIPVTQALTEPRKYIGFDTETFVGTETEPVPDLVCMSVYKDGYSFLYDAKQTPMEFAKLLAHAIYYKVPLVAHFARYDLSVIHKASPLLFPLIARALNDGMIECTFNGEKLDAIARGEYYKKQRLRDGKMYGFNLAQSALLRLGRVLTKDDTRTTFGNLANIPINQWPAKHVEYAIEDARAVHDVRVAMDMESIVDPPCPGMYTYADLPAQTRSDFSLQLQRRVGLRTDGLAIDKLVEEIVSGSRDDLRTLIEWKFYRSARWRPVAKDVELPSCDTKVVDAHIVNVCKQRGITPVYTADTSGGKKRASKESSTNIAKGEDVLAAYNDDKLKVYSKYKSAEKRLSFMETLKDGVDRPIHSEPNNLVANGRTAWGSADENGNVSVKTLNPQQLPRDPGVRECFIPPPDTYYWSVDYGSLELCTVAQACLWLLGKSRLAEMLNNEEPMHDTLSCMFLSEAGIKMTPEEFVEFKKSRPRDILAFGLTASEIRDAAKRGNFGFWGGMGTDRFIEANYDLNLTRASVDRLKYLWKELLPETKDYFYMIGKIAEKNPQFVQLTSGRIRTEKSRGGNTFCELANTVFSGLAADGAKDAMWRITQECWSPEHSDSPLYGSRMCVFVHDEFQGWSHKTIAHLAALRVKEIAERTMQSRLPDLRVTCSVALMCRLRKEAAETYDTFGNLIPWEHGAKFAELLAKGKVTL